MKVWNLNTTNLKPRKLLFGTKCKNTNLLCLTVCNNEDYVAGV